MKIRRPFFRKLKIYKENHCISIGNHYKDDSTKWEWNEVFSIEKHAEQVQNVIFTWIPEFMILVMPGNSSIVHIPVPRSGVIPVELWTVSCSIDWFEDGKKDTAFSEIDESVSRELSQVKLEEEQGDSGEYR